MNGDYWFFSAYAQCGAAITAIIGGFLLTRLLNFIAERHEFKLLESDIKSTLKRKKEILEGFQSYCKKIYFDDDQFILGVFTFLDKPNLNDLCINIDISNVKELNEIQDYYYHYYQRFRNLFTEDLKDLIHNMVEFIRYANYIPNNNVDNFIGGIEVGNENDRSHSLKVAIIRYIYNKLLEQKHKHRNILTDYSDGSIVNKNFAHHIEKVKKEKERLDNSFSKIQERLEEHKQEKVKIINNKPYLNNPEYFIRPFKYLLYLLVISVIIPLVMLLCLRLGWFYPIPVWLVFIIYSFLFSASSLSMYEFWKQVVSKNIKET